MAIDNSVMPDLSAATAIKPQVTPQADETSKSEEVTKQTVQEAIAAAEAAKAQAQAEVEQKAAAAEEELKPEQLEVVVQQLQEFVQTLNRDIAFSVDKESGKDVIKVTNQDTGELVRQIPSEEVLLLAARLSEATGLLVNTEV
ncbi:flagellar protein FlaG [Neiella sp. HB171785]|uniref:Flagellar protein FlaG n=1 Tax=Neiella litorisoli TaxID=2771431 RepID=A0A8J6QVS4_9GAMM|nr:flagellar protein FlaG [Neiella litorisoli]MBD1390853.1 flagellar protein FlaG [Neiella litorisoli]